MTAKEAKHQYQLNQWAGRISERTKSGMSVKNWCIANQVSERVYHYWLKRVREYAAQFLPTRGSLELPAALPGTRIACGEGIAAELMPAAQASSVPEGWAICEPSPPPAESGTGITIEIGNGRITATAATDADLLTKVCRILVAL